MAKHLVTVEIPLEVDYTTTKKNAVCNVYFSANAVSRMECYIDGRHFTPKSVEDDLAIIAKEISTKAYDLKELVAFFKLSKIR